MAEVLLLPIEPPAAQGSIPPRGDYQYVDDQYFLQRGMVDCHLVSQRKYCLRTFYLTLGDGRSYLYNDTLGYVHAGAPFNPEDKSWHQHVSHYQHCASPPAFATALSRPV